MRRIFRLQLLIEFFLILVKIVWWNFRSFLKNKVKDFPERIPIVIKFWFDNVQFLNPINEESFSWLIDFRGFLETPWVLIELIVRIWYSSTTFTFALSASLPLPQFSFTRIGLVWLNDPFYFSKLKELWHSCPFFTSPLVFNLGIL